MAARRDSEPSESWRSTYDSWKTRAPEDEWDAREQQDETPPEFDTREEQRAARADRDEG